MTRPGEPALAAYDNARNALSKSGMVRWLHQHRDVLAERHQRGRISWKALAAVMAADDVRDETGNAPSPETIRRAWHRVRQAEQQMPPMIGPESPATQPVHPVQVMAPAPLADPPAEYTKPNRPRFALAKLRGMETDEGQSAPAPETAARPAKPQAMLDPDEVLRRAGFRSPADRKF